MVEPHFVDHADPDEVFSVLSSERRVRILQALWDAEDHEATFSALRDAVGIRDSGQFSYHLDELVGRFVAKTDAGYELTRAGRRVNGAIQAGSFTMEGSIEPIALDQPCPRCGGTRTLEYADETVAVSCVDCPIGYEIAVPPAVFAGHEREAIPRVASRYLRTTIHHITSGFCPDCDGPLDPRVEPVPAETLRGGGDAEAQDSGHSSDGRGDDGGMVSDLPWIRYTCRHCGSEPTVGLSIAFIDHPAVVCFHRDRGVDVQDRLVWDVADGDPDHETVRSRDPFRASVTYECDGDRLTLTVDAHLNVVRIEG